MKRWHSSGLKLILLLLTLLIVAGIFKTKDSENQVCYRQHCFSVEVARTYAERTQGLMNRDHLAKNSGMLFVFDEEDAYGFWMKNTHMPLDIIWMNKNKEIVFIKRIAQPCSDSACSPFFPDAKSLYVLEINAGLVDALGVRVGEKLDFYLQ